MLEKSLFQNVLKSFRARMGDAWTQETTAKELGVSRRTYNDWENGKSMPSQIYLKRIAAAFELSAEEEDTLYRAAAQDSSRMHNFPFPQNPFFTGREQQLEKISQLLKENSSVVISGLAGIGKTQLALEYAHRYFPNTYRAVLWVNASDERALQASYNELAQRLDLPERDEQELGRRIEAVKRWQETHTYWLLIMDNADDLELARSFLPITHHGHIVLTTRSKIVGTIAVCVDIDRMELSEGLAFLLRRSHLIQDKTVFDTIDVSIRETALQVVELLGGHPLALDQAGAYINETGTSFTSYMQLYQKERRYFLDRRGSSAGSGEHPETVAVSFELCFRKACEQHPMAADILHFCAFYSSPDEILESDLRYFFGYFRGVDTKSFNEAIAVLRKYSLIKWTILDEKPYKHGRLSIHRLVQAVVIEMLSPELQAQWKASAEQIEWATDNGRPINFQE